MPGATERFLDGARAAGLTPDVKRFPQGTKTADDAARAIGCDVGQIVKSLVFMADDTAVIALVSGANLVDEVKLSSVAEVGAVRRASPQEAKAATGFAVGGTPPFGYPGPVRSVVDLDLMAHDELWAAAGTPESVFAISPDDLVRSSGGVVVDLAVR